MLVGTKSAILYVNGKTHILGHSYLGTATADIKNLQGNNTAINGSNEVQDYYQEPAKPSITLKPNSIPQSLLDEMTGAQSGEAGWSTPGDRLPKVGLAVVSPRYGVNKDKVFVFPNCRVSYQSVSLSTNTDSKKNMVAPQLTFNVAYDEQLGGMYTTTEVEKDGAMAAITANKALAWPEGKDDGDFADAQPAQPSASANHDHN